MMIGASTTRGIVYNHLHHYDEDFDAEPFGVKLRCTSLKSNGDDVVMTASPARRRIYDSTR